MRSNGKIFQQAKMQRPIGNLGADICVHRHMNVKSYPTSPFGTYQFPPSSSCCTPGRSFSLFCRHTTTMALNISNTESSFFVVCFLVLFAVRSPLVVLFTAIALFALFLHKRKEIYFLWSIVAPRINGDAVCTFHPPYLFSRMLHTKVVNA
jgi:hypothetical protein